MVAFKVWTVLLAAAVAGVASFLLGYTGLGVLLGCLGIFLFPFALLFLIAILWFVCAATKRHARGPVAFAIACTGVGILSAIVAGTIGATAGLKGDPKFTMKAIEASLFFMVVPATILGALAGGSVAFFRLDALRTAGKSSPPRP
jgi:hypothetical protein